MSDNHIYTYREKLEFLVRKKRAVSPEETLEEIFAHMDRDEEEGKCLIILLKNNYPCIAALFEILFVQV